MFSAIVMVWVLAVGDAAPPPPQAATAPSDSIARVVVAPPGRPGPVFNGSLLLSPPPPRPLAAAREHGPAPVVAAELWSRHAPGTATAHQMAPRGVACAVAHT